MSNNRRTIIIGGGTFNHIRNHLSLAAPAFGTTAKVMNKQLPDSEIFLTKMADPFSLLTTNQHVSDFIDELIDDPSVGTIVMNAAICDFEGTIVGSDEESGKHAERLKTAAGRKLLKLTPSDKIIGRIRLARPDIFLVGFKTTTGADSETQFLTALKFMKSTKCNLVLANDVVTRNNMVITPEETHYSETTDRYVALKELCEMIQLRQNLTYTRTKLHDEPNTSMNATPESFQVVVKYLIENGGFIENNGNGFTPGHFCYKMNDHSFLSSQRKANHNKVFDIGLTKLYGDVNSEYISAYGRTKASVGATSQRLIFDKFPEYDCIIHTHNPQREGSDLPTTQQRPYQCGSLECGINTVGSMKVYDEVIAGVFLEKHGANILFRSSCDPQKVIDFINNNLVLGVKES